MKRSEFIQQTLGVLAALSLPNPGHTVSTRTNLRFAFISDIHIQPESPTQELTRLATAINDRHPDFIVNGGDAIFDALKTPAERVSLLWENWQQFRSQLKADLHSCLGNHDVNHWESPAYKGELPEKEKEQGIKEQKMPARFYHLTEKNWDLIFLDSTQYTPGAYYAGIDELQYQWLENTLNEIPLSRHVLIILHIPIISACYRLYLEDDQKNLMPKIQDRLIHRDSWKLTQLFTKFSHIRACLSGHLHMNESITYRNIPYYCLGSVCGNYWKGDFLQFKRGFSWIELSSDGSVSVTAVTNYY